MKRLLWTFAKWAFGALVIAVFVWRNWQHLERATEQSFDIKHLLFSGLVYLPGLVLTFFRWLILVRAQELPFRAVDALRLGFIGYFFSVFLPGSVTGDLVKAGLLAREQRRRTVAVATIVVDRLVGLLGLVLLVSLLGAIFWREQWVQENAVLRGILFFVWSITAAAVLATVVIPFVPVRAESIIDRVKRVPWVGKVLAEVTRAAQMYRHRSTALAVTVLLAMLGHVGFVLSFWFSALAVEGPTPPLEKHYVIIPVGMVIQAVPLTPGNIGVNEEAYKHLYRLADEQLREEDSFKGAWTCLAQRVMTWVVALIGLGFYWPLRRTVRQVLEQTSVESLLEDGLAPETRPAKETA